MYPVLNKLFILIKQYKEPYLYQIYTEENKSYMSNSYTTEIINKTACEILECCDGVKTIEDVADIITKRYNENYDKVLKIVKCFLNDSEQRRFIYFNELSQLNPIKVYGSYDIITPVNVTFEIAKACPLRCKHCFNNSGNIKENELSENEIMIVLEKLKKIGVQKINLTGGEPTSRKDFIEILKFCSENFIAVAVNSNGYFIDEKFAKDISKYRHNIMFQLSLDGLAYNHDYIRAHDESFIRVVNAIKMLSDSKVIVAIASTINEKNLADIEEVTKLSKSLGASQISYGRTMNLGRAKDNEIADSVDLNKMVEIIKKLRIKYSDEKFFVLDPSEDKNNSIVNEVPSYCSAGVTQICIRENGDVSPCTSIPYVYGNLLKQDVKEVFSPTNVEVFRKLIRPGTYFCKDCKDANTCLGCNATALEVVNDNCSWRKANFLPISFIENMKHYE